MADREAVLFQLRELTNPERLIMIDYLTRSENVWVAEVDATPICVFGVINQTLVSPGAYLWFIETPAFDAYKFVFARHSREVIAEILGRYGIIMGHCIQSNPSSKRWLRWLGADFSAGFDNLVPFEIRAK